MLQLYIAVQQNFVASNNNHFICDNSATYAGLSWVVLQMIFPAVTHGAVGHLGLGLARLMEWLGLYCHNLRDFSPGGLSTGSICSGLLSRVVRHLVR